MGAVFWDELEDEGVMSAGGNGLRVVWIIDTGLYSKQNKTTTKSEIRNIWRTLSLHWFTHWKKTNWNRLINIGIDTPRTKPEACSTSTTTPHLILARTSASTPFLPPPTSDLHRSPPSTSATDLRYRPPPPISTYLRHRPPPPTSTDLGQRPTPTSATDLRHQPPPNSATDHLHRPPPTSTDLRQRPPPTTSSDICHQPPPTSTNDTSTVFCAVLANNVNEAAKKRARLGCFWMKSGQTGKSIYTAICLVQ